MPEHYDLLSPKHPTRSRNNLPGLIPESSVNIRNLLVEKVGELIIGMLILSDDLPEMNYSYYISEELNYDYTYLSNIFSKVKGISIQQFIILHKIEKVKELLTHNELSLKEISNKLHYSSLAHLSNQFKKVTGSTPSLFKQKNRRQLQLENV